MRCLGRGWGSVNRLWEAVVSRRFLFVRFVPAAYVAAFLPVLFLLAAHGFDGVLQEQIDWVAAGDHLVHVLVSFAAGAYLGWRRRHTDRESKYAVIGAAGGLLLSLGYALVWLRELVRPELVSGLPHWWLYQYPLFVLAPLGFLLICVETSGAVDDLQQLRRERAGFQAVEAFSQTVGLMDRDAVLSETVTRMRELTRADACLLFLVDREADVLRVAAHWHHPGKYSQEYVERMVAFPCPRGHGLTGWVMQHEEPILVADTSRDPRAQKAPGQAVIEAKSNLIVPLKARGKLLGVLRLTKDGANQLTRTDQKAAMIFANHAAAALEGSQLYHRVLAASRTDHLTGLPNARAFHEALDEAVGAFKPFALLMIDADALKQVNDQLGHQAGDRLLIDLARAMRRDVGDSGRVFRYAGDEFLVILPDASREEAVAIAERIRASRSCSRIETPTGPIHTTLCVGVAGFPSDGMTAEELLIAADRAMYSAKREGKNGVRVAG